MYLAKSNNLCTKIFITIILSTATNDSIHHVYTTTLLISQKKILQIIESEINNNFGSKSLISIKKTIKTIHSDLRGPSRKRFRLQVFIVSDFEPN